MAVFLLSAFSGLQIRRAYRPKQESTQPRRATTLTRPGCGSSLASALRSAGDALCSWGPRWACRLPPATKPRSSGRPEREEKGRTGRPALLARPHGARTARSRRATGTSCGVQPARLPACKPARLPARKRRVFRRASGASCGAQAARRAARNRRVLRRATGASCDAHPARLAACNRHASAACTLRRPAHTDACKCARSICILNLSVFDFGFGICDIAPVGQLFVLNHIM